MAQTNNVIKKNKDLEARRVRKLDVKTGTVPGTGGPSGQHIVVLLVRTLTVRLLTAVIVSRCMAGTGIVVQFSFQ